MWETWVWSLGQEDPLEKEMATHSRIFAWRIPWTEELGGLQSMGRKESDTTERLPFLSFFPLPLMWGWSEINTLQVSRVQMWMGTGFLEDNLTICIKILGKELVFPSPNLIIPCRRPDYKEIISEPKTAIFKDIQMVLFYVSEKLETVENLNVQKLWNEYTNSGTFRWWTIVRQDCLSLNFSSSFP